MDRSLLNKENPIVNRILLSFKNPELEKDFVDEYNQDWLRGLQNFTITFFLIFGLFAVFFDVSPQFFTSVNNFTNNPVIFPYYNAMKDCINLIFISLLIQLICSPFFFSKLGSRIQLYSVVLDILIYCLLIYVLVVKNDVIVLGLYVAIVYLVIISSAKPFRFIYVFLAHQFIGYSFLIIIIIFCHTRIAIVISLWMLLVNISIFCLFSAYKSELATRTSFYYRRISDEEKNKARELTDLLKNMFGRYLSVQVMNSLIENPSSVELGGERRDVTIMMTDLRGFTAISENLDPEKVVQMLNAYFEIMVDIIFKYNGTVNSFIGDALLVSFGAPQELDNRAQSAIACAIEMQNAMQEVNEQNQKEGLPILEMGIGINDAEVVVGNIGSSKRSSYTLIGNGVNIASRIESCTVGGQVLISESVLQGAGDILRIDNQMDVLPKGSEISLRVYEVGGIGGDYNLVLNRSDSVLHRLANEIPVYVAGISGKEMSAKDQQGQIIEVSQKEALIRTSSVLKLLGDVKLNLINVNDSLSRRNFYGKVLETNPDKPNEYRVCFTFIPEGIDAYFQAAIAFGAKNST